MDGERKNISKLKYCKTGENISIFLIFAITLLIGFNILRIYDDYIMVQIFGYKNTYNFENTLPDKKTVTVIVESDKLYPMLEIIVNGDLVTVFNNRSEATIEVKKGDVIQINGSMYNDDIVVSMHSTNFSDVSFLNKDKIIVQKDIKTLAIIQR